MSDPSTRMLRLLSLLQTPREWPGHELAERLQVTVRTVRRDVGRLRELGYPVHAVPGVAGYRLGAEAMVPPLLLDEEEAVAVAVALGTAESVADIAETSARALAKLEQILPSRLRCRVSTLHSAMVAMRASGPMVPSQALTVISAAIRDRERLRFGYSDHRGAQTARDAEPYRLVHGGRRWYLVAWDTGREDWRTFRVDRLTLRTPNGPRFTPRPLPAADIAAYISHGVSTAAYRHKGRFTMHASAAAVAERIGPVAAAVEALDDDRCVLHTGADSLEEMSLYVARLGFGFDVHEPRELIGHLRALADRLGSARHEAWVPNRDE